MTASSSSSSPSSSPPSSPEGRQPSVPAATLSWADLDDEELDELDDQPDDTLTKQQRLCRERYLAMEAVYGDDQSSRPAHHTDIDEYDDDYDFSEDEEFPLDDDVDNFSDDDQDQPDQEVPSPEATEEQPAPEPSSQEPLVPVASVEEPPQMAIKVTPHGIHYDTVDRLSDAEAYDVQHRYHFPPLIPRDHDTRIGYPHNRHWQYWYCGPPGSSSLRQAQSTEPEEETPLLATPAEITASAETPVASVQESPKDAIAREITASAENPVAPADEILAVLTPDSPLDTEFDHQSNEETTSLSLSSATATPDHACPQTVNTESAVIIGGEETVYTENPVVKERPPNFRSLLFVRVIAVLDNARKVADATLELIR